MSYKTGRYTMRQIARRGVSPSVFYSGGRFRESCRDIVEAVARYAARIAIERAHCVWLRIDIPATHILDLDLRDRVRVIDARLPGGRVEGKIIGWDIQIGASAPGQLVLACPISTGTGNAATLRTSTIDIDGDVDVSSTAVMDAVKNDDAMALVTKFSMIDAAAAQAIELGASTETSPIEDPQGTVSETGIEVELLDLTPVEYDPLLPTKIKLEPFELRLPRGIAL